MPQKRGGPRPAAGSRPKHLAAASIGRLAAPGGRQRDPACELDAWALAVVHLHSLGLPAPAPDLVARQLRRRGIYPDWITAA
jgi:hypothetical protein